MTTYIIRRLLLMVPTLLGVTAVVFFVMALAPGGFGGTFLNQQGALTEGEEAKRIRQEFSRRYGLGKPAVVQYGRWLNQVSPIGFLTSSQLRFDDVQLAPAREIISDSELLVALDMTDPATQLAGDLAAYFDQTPDATAVQLVAALDKPLDGLAMLERFDQFDASSAVKVRELAGDDPSAARRKLLDAIAFEIAGRDRVLFARPCFKWPNLGLSLRGRPVGPMLVETVPITLLLNVITIPVIYIIAIVVGVMAARHRGKQMDVWSNIVLLGLWSVPAMWVGVMLIGYLANKQYVHLFPTGGLHDIQADTMPFLPRWADGFERGYLLDLVWHLVLPVICLTYGSFAVLAKLTRGSILENLAADFVRTARAKGVDQRHVLYRHVLRNSLLPLITVFAAILPSLFVGSVIVETIFSIQGMGKLAVDAAFMKDREVVMGTTLIGGIIGLLSALFRDIWYAVADPRVSYE